MSNPIAEFLRVPTGGKPTEDQKKLVAAIAENLAERKPDTDYGRLQANGLREVATQLRESDR